MTDTIDRDSLIRVVGEFARTLAGRYEISDVLYQLVEDVVTLLRVAGAGVSLRDEENKLRPVTGINSLTTRIEATEEALQEGPCVDAFRHGGAVVVADLDDERNRWPHWSSYALNAGIHAVLGIPLAVRGEPIGAMNVYAAERRDWTPTEIETARLLADMAASYVANASDLEKLQRTAEQLRYALESRIIIEQAKGILAAEYHCTVDQAFVLLRDQSRAHGARLREVAHAVVHLGLRPPHKPRN
ncbi:MAG: GAF and ANTAR domain-containing protein [Acidothermus sp.]|nr:GAF and ANTAR domain-containing protein [Acidothermus sp.]